MVLVSRHALGYMLFCTAIHMLSWMFTEPVTTWMGLKFPPNSRQELYNQIVSSYHSSLFSLMYIYVWTLSGTQDMSFKDDDAVHPLDRLLLEVMIGYMLYDTIFEMYMMTEGRKSWSAHSQILLHHIMGLVTHGMIIDMDSGIAGRLMLVIYGAEVSTPFLNSSWILDHFDLSSNFFFKIVTGAVFFTFLYRLCVGPYVLYCLISRASQWTYYPLLFNILCLVASVFSLLNFFWFYKLYKKAARHHKKLAQQREAAAGAEDKKSK